MINTLRNIAPAFSYQKNLEKAMSEGHTGKDADYMAREQRGDNFLALAIMAGLPAALISGLFIMSVAASADAEYEQETKQMSALSQELVQPR